MGLILIGYAVIALVVAVGLCMVLGVPRGKDWWQLAFMAGLWPICLPLVVMWDRRGRPTEPPEYDPSAWEKVIVNAGFCLVLLVFVGGIWFAVECMDALTYRPKPVVEGAE